jgi:hypothetical protein
MSLFRHEEIYRSDVGSTTERLKGNRPKPAPPTIVSMSLRLAIPWRVGLHQSPPPFNVIVSAAIVASAESRTVHAKSLQRYRVLFFEGRSLDKTALGGIGKTHSVRITSPSSA